MKAMKKKLALFETDAWKIFHKHVIKMLFTGFQFLEWKFTVIEQKVLETLTMWNNNKKMVVGGGIKESELISHSLWRVINRYCLRW